MKIRAGQWIRVLLIASPFLVYAVAQTSRLHDAVRTGSVAKVDSAMKPWKSLNAKNRHGDTPLGIAILRNDLAIVSLLTERGAVVRLDEPDAYRDHLMQAILQNKTEIVRLLVDRGADTKRANAHHGTALHAAAKAGNIEIVRLLLFHGAQVNALDSQGRTPIFACFGTQDPKLRNSRLEIAELLIRKGANLSVVTPDKRMLIDGVLYAPDRLDMEQLKLLLDHGFPLGRLGERASPLYYASRARKLDIVKVLLDYGADANDGGIECRAGSCAGRSTALHQAAEVSYHKDGIHAVSLDIATLLIKRGAKVNVVDHLGHAPLMYAARSGNALLVRALLDAGADPNVGSFYYKPLDAAKAGEIAQMLREAGACYGKNPECKPRAAR